MSEMGHAGQVFTVSQLTENLREQLERRFPFVWVRGEITNFSRSGAGHIYFSLKDASAQLQCVWFAYQQRRASNARNFDPLTGEVYESPRPDVSRMMRNGMEVLCAGPISIYPARSQYQLTVEYVQPGGEGSLALAFEARKQKYAALGYFKLERKRPLPANIRRLALVVSLHGAAIHDFFRLAANRGLGATIRIFPVPAQGAGAAEKIASAINEANSQNWAQAIALVRGGGSLEDLWAFNEEAIAQAVFESRLPVVAGIGHETDFTLADMTADLRAATPSHAAQLLWPLRGDYWQKLADLDQALNRHARELPAMFSQKLQNLERLLASSARWKMEKYSNALNNLDGDLRKTGRLLPVKCEQKLLALESGLRFLSPVIRLKRYSENLSAACGALRGRARYLLEWKFRRLEGAEANLKTSWRPEERLARLENELRLFHGAISSLFGSALSHKEKLLGIAGNSLREKGDNFLQAFSRRIYMLDCKLGNLNPYAPLLRGYSILTSGGKVVRGVNDCAPGDSLEALLADGVLDVKVEKVKPGAIMRTLGETSRD